MTDTAHDAAHHPGPGTYAFIALILTVITLIEFGLFYVEPLRAMSGVFVTLLVVLSAIKFALVAMFYMHLKFDHGVFTRLLITGMALGAAVLLSLLTLFFIAHPPNLT